jgi:hypothetical protein
MPLAFAGHDGPPGVTNKVNLPSGLGEGCTTAAVALPLAAALPGFAPLQLAGACVAFFEAKRAPAAAAAAAATASGLGCESLPAADDAVVLAISRLFSPAAFGGVIWGLMSAAICLPLFSARQVPVLPRGALNSAACPPEVFLPASCDGAGGAAAAFLLSPWNGR